MKCKEAHGYAAGLLALYHFTGDEYIHAVLVRNAAAVTIEDPLLQLLHLPVGIAGEQLPRGPEGLFLLPVRRHRQKDHQLRS